MVLTKMFGSKDAFVDLTYDYLGFEPRHFKNYIALCEEAGMLRLYGRIYYLPSIKAGFSQGEKIADTILNTLIFKK